MSFNPIVTDLGKSKYDEFFQSMVFVNEGFDTGKDNVLPSTMRYLLNADRLATFTDHGGKYRAQCIIEESKLENCAGDDFAKVVSDAFDGYRSPFSSMRSGIYVCILRNDNTDAIYEKMASVDEGRKKNGWERLKDIELYIDRTGKSYVYQNNNSENQSVVVFTHKSREYQVVHLIASCLPRIFPWAFDQNPLTEDETATLSALFNKNDATFIAGIQKFVAENDFYSQKLKATVGGFFKKNYDELISNQQEKLGDIRSNISSELRRINELNDKLEEEQMRLMILRNKAIGTDDDEREIIEFLKSNTDLTVLSKSDRYIRVGVNCFLDDYDEDMYNTYIAGEDSMTAYAYSDSPYTLEETKRLYNSIWGTRRFKLRVYCEWKLYNNCKVDAVQYSNMNNHQELTSDRLPQPHIDRYTCYDGYRTTFNQLAQEMNYIGVLSTILCSSKSINWTDSTVVSYLMRSLFGYSGRCLEDADGNLYTVSDVVKILNAENEVKE